MGSRAGGILQLVQQLWGNFPHDLVRASVVGVLTSVVKALKDDSTEYHEFLVGVRGLKGSFGEVIRGRRLTPQ